LIFDKSGKQYRLFKDDGSGRNWSLWQQNEANEWEEVEDFLCKTGIRRKWWSDWFGKNACAVCKKCTMWPQCDIWPCKQCDVCTNWPQCLPSHAASSERAATEEEKKPTADASQRSKRSESKRAGAAAPQHMSTATVRGFIAGVNQQHSKLRLSQFSPWSGSIAASQRRAGCEMNKRRGGCDCKVNQRRAGCDCELAQRRESTLSPTTNTPATVPTTSQPPVAAAQRIQHQHQHHQHQHRPCSATGSTTTLGGHSQVNPLDLQKQINEKLDVLLGIGRFIVKAMGNACQNQKL